MAQQDLDIHVVQPKVLDITVKLLYLKMVQRLDMKIITWADPESYVRGGPTLTTFF